MREKGARIWGTVTPERQEQLQKWADELGLQFSQFIGLCVWVGARQVMRQVHPEQFFTTDQWAAVIMKAVEHLPEDQRVEWVTRIQEEAKQLQGANNEAAEVGGLLPE